MICQKQDKLVALRYNHTITKENFQELQDEIYIT